MRCHNCGYDNIPGIDLCEKCGSDLAGHELPEAQVGFRGRLMTDHVGDLELIAPLYVELGTTAAEAIAVMRDAGHGCVLVRDQHSLVGIFTERDVLTRVVRPGKDPSALTMQDVMTPRPTVLAPADPPAYAIHLSTARGLRHLPVVDEQEVLGFISVRHLLRYIHEDVLGRD